MRQKEAEIIKELEQRQHENALARKRQKEETEAMSLSVFKETLQKIKHQSIYIDIDDSQYQNVLESLTQTTEPTFKELEKLDTQRKWIDEKMETWRFKANNG